MMRYRTHCDFQGAWGMPRLWRRMIGGDFIDTRGMEAARHG